MTVGGQKGTETTTQRRDAEGHIVAGSVSYDGVRVAKVVPVDTGSSLEPHRFSGVQSSTVEQSPDGVRMTLVTDNGKFSFPRQEKGWHAENDVSEVPSAAHAQTRGLPTPGLPAAGPAAAASTEAAPAPVAPFIPRETDQGPVPANPSDAAPVKDAPPAEAAQDREHLIALQRQLMNQSVSNADKLKAVHALHDAGVEKFQLKDADGAARTYTIKEESLGNRTMVHVFAGGDDGKNHVVLRGLMDGSGEMHQERDRSGRAVNFAGDYWSQSMAGKTPFAPPTDQAPPRAAQPTPDNSFDPYDLNGRRRAAAPEQGTEAPPTGRPWIPREGDQTTMPGERRSVEATPSGRPWIPREGDQTTAPGERRPVEAAPSGRPWIPREGEPPRRYYPQEGEHRPPYAPYDVPGRQPGVPPEGAPRRPPYQVPSPVTKHDPLLVRSSRQAVKTSIAKFSHMTADNSRFMIRPVQHIPSNTEERARQYHRRLQILRDSCTTWRKKVAGSVALRCVRIATRAGGLRAPLNNLHMGFHIEGNFGNSRFRSGVQLGAYLAKSGIFDVVPLKSVPKLVPGMIKVSNWNFDNPSQSFFSTENLGDIQIIGDGSSVHPDGGRYSDSYVLVPKGYYAGQRPQPYAPQNPSVSAHPHYRPRETYQRPNGQTYQDAPPEYPSAQQNYGSQLYGYPPYGHRHHRYPQYIGFGW